MSVSIQTKLFHLIAQGVYKSEHLDAVSWDYPDLNCARYFMLSGHLEYEPLTIDKLFHKLTWFPVLYCPCKSIVCDYGVGLFIFTLYPL